jgi:hypothetical protein
MSKVRLLGTHRIIGLVAAAVAPGTPLGGKAPHPASSATAAQLPSTQRPKPEIFMSMSPDARLRQPATFDAYSQFHRKSQGAGAQCATVE